MGSDKKIVEKVDQMSKTTTDANGRFQIDLVAPGMSDIVRDTWVDSYKSVDRSYDALRQLRNSGDPSGVIVHQESNSFRSDRPLVQHFTQMLTDKENLASRSSILGVNHLTQAINIEKANEVKEV